MTILNWALTPYCATIFCDALSTVDDRPARFSSKAWCVPHLSLILAGAGWAWPGRTLYSRLAMGHAPHGIDELVSFSVGALRTAAQQFPDFMACSPRTREVLFVWDSQINEIAGWVFRAEQNFEAERLPADGMCMLEPMPIAYVGDRDWFGVAVQQQNEDFQRLQSDRVNIGGVLSRYEMKVVADGRAPVITISNLGQLPHFEDHAAQVAAFSVAEERHLVAAT